MKKAVIFLLLIPLVFISCGMLNNLMGISDDELDVTKGAIIGKALLRGVDDNSGILISLEPVVDNRTLTVQRSIDFGSLSDRVISGQTRTVEDGSYEFTDLEAGTYIVYASREDSVEKAVSSEVTVIAKEIATVADLELSPTGSISGTVTIDDQAEGNQGILVFVAGTSFMAMTDSTGNYEISGVPVGNDYTLIAYKSDCFESDTVVSVTSGTSTAAPALAIYSKDGLVGRLTVELPTAHFYQEGYDADWFEVWVMRQDGYYEESRNLNLSEDLSSANRDFFYLPAGTYEIAVAVHHDWRDSVNTDFHVWTETKIVDLRKDQVETLSFEIPWSAADTGSVNIAMNNIQLSNLGVATDLAGVWLNNQDGGSDYHFHLNTADGGDIFTQIYEHIKPGTYDIEILTVNDNNVEWSQWDWHWRWDLGSTYFGDVTVSAGVESPVIGTLAYDIASHEKDSFYIWSTSDLNGLAWDDVTSTFWGADYNNNVITNFDTAGNTLADFEITGLAGGINGMTWDGLTLWVSTYADSMIYQIDPADGSVLSSFSTGLSDHTALAFDGTDLWVADPSSGQYHQFNTAGTLQKSIGTLGSEPDGMTFFDGFLWSTSLRDNGIFKIDTAGSGTVLGFYPLPQGHHSTLIHDGTNFWTFDQYSQMLYKITDLQNTMTVLFEDNFDQGYIDDRYWDTWNNYDEEMTLHVNAEGWVEASTNGNELYFHDRRFWENFRLEFDVKKEGSSDFNGWDFKVEGDDAWIDLTLRFDWDGQHMLRLNDGPEKFITSTGNLSEGKLVITRMWNTITAQFISTTGEVLLEDERWTHDFGDTSFSIWIAALDDSPRLIDNVRVYKLGDNYQPMASLKNIIDTGLTLGGPAHYGMVQLPDESLLLSGYAQGAFTRIETVPEPDILMGGYPLDMPGVNNPHGIALDPDGTTVWVTDPDNAQILNLNIVDGTVNTASTIDTVSYNDRQPVGALVVGTTLYIGDRLKDGIWAYDISGPSPVELWFQPLYMMREEADGYMDIFEYGGELYIVGSEIDGFVVMGPEGNYVEHYADYSTTYLGVYVQSDIVYLNSGYNIVESSLTGDIFTAHGIPRPMSYTDVYIELEIIIDGTQDVFYVATAGDDPHIISMTF